MAGAPVVMSEHDRDGGWAPAPNGGFQSRLPAHWQGARATHGVAHGEDTTAAQGARAVTVGAHADAAFQRTLSASLHATAGKACFEVTLRDTGLCRVGWASATASLALGTDTQGFGFGSTGKKSVASKFEDYGEPYSAGDTITCCLDHTSGTMTYFKNGRALGLAFRLPPVLHATALFPAVLLKVGLVPTDRKTHPPAHAQQGVSWSSHAPLPLAPEKQKEAARWEGTDNRTPRWSCTWRAAAPRPLRKATCR